MVSEQERNRLLALADREALRTPDSHEEEAYLEGRHIPAYWTVMYDAAYDGCMPKGWYLAGMQDNDEPCDYPIRHHYGPFRYLPTAVAFIKKVNTDLRKDEADTKERHPEYTPRKIGYRPCYLEFDEYSDIT